MERACHFDCETWGCLTSIIKITAHRSTNTFYLSRFIANWQGMQKAASLLHVHTHTHTHHLPIVFFLCRFGSSTHRRLLQVVLCILPKSSCTLCSYSIYVCIVGVHGYLQIHAKNELEISASQLSSSPTAPNYECVALQGGMKARRSRKRDERLNDEQLTSASRLRGVRTG